MYTCHGRHASLLCCEWQKALCKFCIYITRVQVLQLTYQNEGAVTFSIVAMQVQGRALLPGAAMVEMASSAGALLLSRTGAGAALARAAGTLTLVGASIPAPLLLPSTGDGVLLVSLDGTRGRCSVQSQLPGSVTFTSHMTCSYITACAAGSAATAPRAGIEQAASSQALMAGAPLSERDSGEAVAHITQTWPGQSDQYSVHPAVLDNCTQVRSQATIGTT